MEHKKCLLGLDNDGVFTPIKFPKNKNTIYETETIRRLESIQRKIMPIIKLKILKGDKEETYNKLNIFTMINNFDRDYLSDFNVLLTVLQKYNCSTSIISKVAHNHGPITIPDILINHKDKFNQLVLCPCDALEIKMLQNKSISRNSNRTGSIFYWYYNNLTSIGQKLTEITSDRRQYQLKLYIRGLIKLRDYYKKDNDITFEKVSYNEYDNHDSGKYIDWSPDKGQAMEDHLQGDTIYFVDDDIDNFKIITDHFKLTNQKIKLFMMTHFIKSDDPDKLYVYNTSDNTYVIQHDHINPYLVQFYHIDNFLQLVEHMEKDLSVKL